MQDDSFNKRFGQGFTFCEEKRGGFIFEKLRRRTLHEIISGIRGGAIRI